jgi:steroid 5-alpha reductase family enzyme
MHREDLIAAIVFASGAGLLLMAVAIQYLREKRLPIGSILSCAGLFCAALTRFPNMQGEIFFWSTIALFAVSAVVSIVELAIAIHKRRSAGSPPEDNLPKPEGAPASS